jgi:acetyl-CoA carboxylase biotin carboxyl carrier protein
MPSDSPAEQVSQFAAWLAGTDIAQLELRTVCGVLVVRRDGATTPEHDGPSEPAAPSPMHRVTAPSVGVFLHRHPMHGDDESPPLARAGQAVRAGQIVGFLRIGPLLLPVHVPNDGVIADVAATHEEIVGYGATLMHLTRDGGRE